MTDIQCAIGISQLSKFDFIKKRKAEIKEMYFSLLMPLEELTFFEPDAEAEWIPFRVGVLTNDAHELMKFLTQAEIETRTFFYPLHKQPCYRSLLEKMNLFDKDFPNTIFGYEHGVCLPTFPSLTEEQINYVCKTILNYYGK